MRISFLSVIVKSMLLFVCFIFFVVDAGAQTGVIQLRTDSSAYVRSVVLRDQRAGNAWWWGWLAGYSSATMAQGIIGVTASRLSTRQDMLLGAATTLVGAAGQLVTPLKPGIFNKLPLPANCYDSLRVLALAESKGRNWQMHAEACALNLGSGLVTWLGFKRTAKDGLLNFALNTAVTEAQIWMQPVRARNFFLKNSRKAMFSNRVHRFRKYDLNFAMSPYGMRLAVRF